MKPLLTFAALALALLAPARAAEEHPPHAPKETYASGLGEIMSLQQMRHLKLWLIARRVGFAAEMLRRPESGEAELWRWKPQAKELILC